MLAPVAATHLSYALLRTFYAAVDGGWRASGRMGMLEYLLLIVGLVSGPADTHLESQPAQQPK